MSFRLILASTSLIALAACGEREPAAPVEATQTITLTAEAIERATPVAVAPTPTPAPTEGEAATPPAQPDPGLIRVQILLDRSTFSPGVIDGLAGDNTRQAAAAFRSANGMTGDAVDADLLRKLAETDRSAAMTEYTLTEADLAGPFSPPPGDLASQARNGVNYTSVRERIAERFHITEPLLQALNPDVDFRRAGVRIVVPAVSDNALPEVTRIVVDKTERSLRAFDASNRLVAFYPATIGSTERPAPSGTLTVVGVAKEPDYTYDPDKLSYDRGPNKITVPAGPNNPVGSTWIALSRQSYGIHGTPDPSKVAKTASNGCIRLTNWDAQQLAAAVKPGVEVRFV
ncbi:hypothetical protein GCM10009422_18070 [Brevundimonas kwangchunensis]|uniref:L,D-TPase catalytic domain-containing protein n=1 Tax=Brevundimonas kwangchunensis TaxID=322163 RepID=A0ABN1GX66_9CAUL